MCTRNIWCTYKKKRLFGKKGEKMNHSLKNLYYSHSYFVLSTYLISSIPSLHYNQIKVSLDFREQSFEVDSSTMGRMR